MPDTKINTILRQRGGDITATVYEFRALLQGFSRAPRNRPRPPPLNLVRCMPALRSLGWWGVAEADQIKKTSNAETSVPAKSSDQSPASKPSSLPLAMMCCMAKTTVDDYSVATFCESLSGAGNARSRHRFRGSRRTNAASSSIAGRGESAAPIRSPIPSIIR